MSKSLGNLVFVDKLRTEWDPMVIRLGLIEHHYRTEWEWDDELMPRNAERLRRWRDSADGQASDLLEEVRERLDDDLDTPGAVAAVDAAAARGASTRAAADPAGRAARPCWVTARGIGGVVGSPHRAFTKSSTGPHPGVRRGVLHSAT